MAGVSESEQRLRERIEELEAENRELRVERDAQATVPIEPLGASGPADAAPRRRGRWRVFPAIVLITVGALLTPVAIVGGYARQMLTNTEVFVQALAPLAEEPAVQEAVSDAIVDAIAEQIDIPGLTAQLFDGLAGLELPPAAANALRLLQGPAAEGAQSLIDTTVTGLVESPAFADIWEQALRLTHTQLIATMEGRADAALGITSDGLVVQLGPVLAAVKERLLAQGIGIASLIPDTQQTIVVADGPAARQAAFWYAVIVASGTWLPWVALAALAGGVLFARKRRRALIATAIIVAATSFILLAGLGIGREVAAVSAAEFVAPDAVRVAFAFIVAAMRDTAIAVGVLGIAAAIIAWFSGPGRFPVAFRALISGWAARLRGFADAHDVGTGAFGRWLDRSHGVVLAGIGILAVVAVLLIRPVSVASVVWTAVIALFAVLLVELLRRPADAGTAPPSPESEPGNETETATETETETETALDRA